MSVLPLAAINFRFLRSPSTRFCSSVPSPSLPVKWAVSLPAPPRRVTSVTAVERDMSTLAMSSPAPSDTLSLPMGLGALPVLVSDTVSSPLPVFTVIPPIPPVWASTSTLSLPSPVLTVVVPWLALFVTFTLSSPSPVSMVISTGLLSPLKVAFTVSSPASVEIEAEPSLTVAVTVSSPSPVFTCADAPSFTSMVTSSSPAPVSMFATPFLPSTFTARLSASLVP